MNIRTNIRNINKDAVYTVVVRLRGRIMSAGRYIYAELVGITYNELSHEGVAESLPHIYDGVYQIQYGEDGVTSVKKAVKEAVRRFELEYAEKHIICPNL